MTGAQLTVPSSEDLRYFRGFMWAMVVVMVAGFTLHLAAGRSSFDAPLVVHIHAVFFMGWVGIVAAQSWLAGAGSFALHRQLGRVAVLYCAALLVMGPLATVHAVQTGRAPFVFQPQHFLIVNPLSMLPFVGLLAAAVILRRQGDWHARLQVGAFLALMGPGFGRLLPLPLLMPYAFDISVLAALVPAAIGMRRDIKVHGKVHPAWWWSVGSLIMLLVIARLVAFSPLGAAVYNFTTANTPMAGTDGLAFPPPPGPPPGAR